MYCASVYQTWQHELKTISVAIRKQFPSVIEN